MYRLEETLLTKINNKWYYKNQLFVGIIFFRQEENIIDAYEVKDGVIIKPYVSPCQQNLPSPIQLDSSEFCNEDKDEYGSGMMPQMYKNKVYQGMSYTFIKGRCNREVYTDEDGITINQVTWDIFTYEPDSLEIHTNKEWIYFKNGSSKNFTYQKFDGSDELVEQISLSFNGKVNKFIILGDILNTKSYSNSPISLPKIYNLIEGYKNFIFDKFVRFDLDKNIIEELFSLWLENNSFKDVEKMYITGLNGIKDLNLFNDKKVFSNLAELCIKESELLPEKIEQLKTYHKKFNLIIYK